MTENFSNSRLLEQTLNRFYGKYRGKVVNNNDPLNRGRLEVEVKSVLRDEKFWAMPCVPFGGKSMGLFMIPENGTGVWIEFEGGDISHPIWTGCYWADDESPKDEKTAEPKVRLIKSASGLTISLDDQDEIVTIRDNDGRNTIVIDVHQGKISIESSSTIVLNANNVQLGSEAAAQPVVKGFELITYLNLLATSAMSKLPSGVNPPPTISMLSQQVKTV